MAVGVIARHKGGLFYAIGWVPLAFGLSNNLQASDASVVLYSLVIADIFAWLLVFGLEKSRPDTPRHQTWEDVIGKVLLRWILLSVTILVLALYKMIPFFEHHEYALICVIGLCLGSAMLRLMCTFRLTYKASTVVLVELRFLFLAIGVFGLAKIGSSNPDIILSLALGLLLLTLMAVCWGVVIDRTSEQSAVSRSGHFDQLLRECMPFLLRYADLLVLPFMMPFAFASSYLIARGLAQFIPLVLGQLAERVAETLECTFDDGNHSAFVGGAARTNLGFLLIGGAASLATFSIGTHVPRAFDLDPTFFQAILLWLIIAQVSPVIFGATGLLMNIAGMKKEIAVLSLIGVMIIWTVTCGFFLIDPQHLAQLFAYVQLSIGAVSALLLGLRFGIWPGLTALLFRQIKLL